MSHAGRVESGAQLLARLGPRPSIHGLETAVPGFELTPGNIIELYGKEGVGKTELLLHLVVSALLPSSKGQRGYHDNQAQVLWVDCDVKFSVLRLAVLLEQRIVNMAGNSGGKDNAVASDNSSVKSNSDEICDGSTKSVLKVSEIGDTSDGCRERSGKSSLKLNSNKVHAYGKDTQNYGDKHDPSDGCIGSFGEYRSENNRREQCDKGEIANSTFIQLEYNQRNSGDADMSSKHKTCEGKSRMDLTGVKRKACELDSDSACVQKPQESVKARGNGSEKANTRRSLPGSAQAGSDKTRCKNLQDFGEGSYEASKLQQDSVSLVHNSTAGRKCSNLTVHTTLASVPDTPDSENAPMQLSQEEVEKRVQECMERVQVARCTSSQQLLCTLHSLESAIASNRNIVLLVVDSVSAFFWSDRCKDLSSGPSSVLQKNMSCIANIVRKMAQSYGILVAVTKQALIKARPRDSVVSPAEGSGVSSGADNHVEFLGKAWSDAVTQRIVCSKCVQRDNKGVLITRYTLTGGSGSKHFVICENGVCFDDD